ncbi:MAG: AAA family ATPase [Alicyclobacillaceae bacterium]|nr:AAA family ATPase [Alicyclobacillaceae bacterium]
MKREFTVLGVRYYQPQTRYAVLSADDGQTYTGSFFEPNVGYQYEVDGKLTSHPKFGDQYEVSRSSLIWPQGKMASLAFLKGIVGYDMATEVLRALGDDAVKDIKFDPKLLEGAVRIPSAFRKKIALTVRKQKDFEEVDAVLRNADFTPQQIASVRAEYGEDTGRKIREDPYRMVLDVEGIRFADAERLARSLNTALSSTARLQGAVLDALCMAERSGHTWQYAWQIQHTVNRLLGSQIPIDAALAALVESEDVVAFGSHLSLASTYIAERGIAKEITRLVDTGRDTSQAKFPDAKGDIVFSEEQKRAVLRTLLEPVCVLTGGAGVGKTTVVRAIVEQYQAAYPEAIVCMAAPTGKAAQRLSECTERDVSTIHRLLAYHPHGSRFVPTHNADCPLDVDFLIVDEASMLTVELMYRIVRALKDGTKLLLVGDTQQLSAIGAGAVLRDLQDIVPTARLTTVFRQGEDSHIVHVAHSVAQGHMPEFRGDCTFFECGQDEAVRDVALSLAEKTLQSGWKAHQVQVLMPRRTGEFGLEAFNHPLQALFNPQGEGAAKTKFFHYRVGDRVIQRINDHVREIVNGELGEIKSYNNNRTYVLFSDKTPVAYDSYEIYQLQPAYACTVHQFQGSQMPVVIVVLMDHDERMLNRNLLYTAITRAEAHCLLVGTANALEKAVLTEEPPRQTNLCRFDELLAQRMIEALSVSP